MPAAAVIPAPIAYIKVVAVKKLVVGFLCRAARSATLWCDCGWSVTSLWGPLVPLIWCLSGTASFTVKKLECSKQAYAVNTLAWNNKIGLWFYFVGWRPR